MEFLYHGSIVQGLEVLEPRKRYTPAGAIEYVAIYATPLPVFAAMHSFPWSSDEGFDIDIENKTLIVPHKYTDRLNMTVSIYKISASTFQITIEEETGQTWHSTDLVKVIEEEKYENVEKAILTLGGKVKVITTSTERSDA